MPALNSSTLAPTAPVSMTRAGLPKQRYSLNDKLTLLDSQSNREATLSRIEDYRRLFAFRVTNGIITKRGQGPRAWTAFRGVLGDNEIIRHLLVDRLPGRQPVWYGARSFSTSLFLCLDVDTDRSPEPILASTHDIEQLPTDMLILEQHRNETKLTHEPARPSFSRRCSQVERAFRRLGINPENPKSVLIQRTPSGGRHYYFFLDAPYHLDQYHDLLNAAGLSHVSGEIEFFPSTKQALRLPFGLIPNHPHDPSAWIQFIDDYRNHRIIRHSLADLYDNLAKHHASQTRRIESRKKSAKISSPTEPTLFMMGIPKAARIHPTQLHSLPVAPSNARYQELLDGTNTPAEAEELMSMGIRLPSTRTIVLKHLAAHLIWFKHLSSTDATQILNEWALDPRHVSKDILNDLTHCTTAVAQQINYLCQWYEQRKKTLDVQNPGDNPQFSLAELQPLHQSLAGLTQEDRIKQAEFLLHFLRFAKRHGTPTEEGSAWNAAPAVRQVIRKWPHCSHMQYKDRMNQAVSTCIIHEIKGPWHHSNGPGRATTYRISVPVIPKIKWVLSYEAALDYLISIDQEVHPEETSHAQSPAITETPYANHPARADTNDPNKSNRGAFPPTVPPACARESLDPCPRQCNPISNATPGLSGEDPGEMRTNSHIIPRATSKSHNTAASYPVKRLSPWDQRVDLNFKNRYTDSLKFPVEQSERTIISGSDLSAFTDHIWARKQKRRSLIVRHVVEFLGKTWRKPSRGVAVFPLDFSLSHLAGWSAIPRMQFLILRHTPLPLESHVHAPPASPSTRHNANLSQFVCVSGPSRCRRGS